MSWHEVMWGISWPNILMMLCEIPKEVDKKEEILTKENIQALLMGINK